MAKVGLREFKNKLSRYVARARDGESVSITDRGRVVAELTPAKRYTRDGRTTTTLEALRQSGVLHGAGPNAASLYPSMPRILKRPVSDLLDDERGSR